MEANIREKSDALALFAAPARRSATVGRKYQQFSGGIGQENGKVINKRGSVWYIVHVWKCSSEKYKISPASKTNASLHADLWFAICRFSQEVFITSIEQFTSRTISFSTCTLFSRSPLVNKTLFENACELEWVVLYFKVLPVDWVLVL